jgi:hypothetical protein
MERYSLVGSALKRRIMVRMAAGPHRPSQHDVREMRAAYEAAVQRGQAEHSPDLHYPASNCLATDAALSVTTREHRLDRACKAIVKEAVKGHAEFWTEASRIELQQYEAVKARAVGRRRKKLERQYADLYKRATSTRMWASIYDSAWFLLTFYGERSSSHERAASAALLKILRGFAHPTL